MTFNLKENYVEQIIRLKYFGKTSLKIDSILIKNQDHMTIA